jgi:hypothetical protein
MKFHYTTQNDMSKLINCVFLKFSIYYLWPWLTLESELIDKGTLLYCSDSKGLPVFVPIVTIIWKLPTEPLPGGLSLGRIKNSISEYLSVNWSWQSFHSLCYCVFPCCLGHISLPTLPWQLLCLWAAYVQGSECLTPFLQSKKLLF